MSFVQARRAAALLATLALAACGDATAPTIDSIDATAASAKVEPVLAVMDQPALASFASLGAVTGLPASASAASLTAVARLTSAAAHGRWDRSTPLFARTAARSADVLPGDVRGNRYVYNEQTASYEVAADPAGAPENGIRVVLYAWDVLAGVPSSPLTEIGHVDLIDQSTAAQNRLNVLLVRAEGNAELMNYAITHSVTTSSESFSIAGSATNGTTPVTFTLSGTMNETAATVTFDLSAASIGFSVHVGASVSALTEEANVDISLGYDGHTLAFRMSLNANGMSGEVKFDNMRYATWSMTYDPATGTVTTQFAKANGQPLTVEELEQITALFERAVDFDAFWAGLLWPVGAIGSAGLSS
jgi:hypothetical protein